MSLKREKAFINEFYIISKPLPTKNIKFLNISYHISVIHIIVIVII